MIKEIQSFWAESEKKRIKTVAEQFHLSLPCAKKYIYMSSKELEELEKVLPPDVICFKRTEILKYLLTCNPKKQKDLELGKYIDVIKEAYPVAAYVETVFKDFHRIIMGNSPDEIDVFIEQYEESVISTFCKGLKKDIAPVKNAISHRESSGFVEGNNNKFKLLKRIVYGRSGLVNLSKKCKLAFMLKDDAFTLSSLI